MRSIARSRRRILIGATSFADARAALGIADWLAETLASDLAGVLMEDQVLTELCAAPGQCVVTMGGTIVPAPSVARLQAVIDSDVRSFRKALKDIATHRRRGWSFERQTGELVEGVWKAAHERDILLLGQGRHPLGVGRVVVISPSNGVPDRMAELGRTLAGRLQADLVTVSPQDPAADGLRDFTWADETELLRWLSRLRAAAVIVDLTAGPLTTPEQLRQVVEVARCPVLVLGKTGSSAPTPEGESPDPTDAPEPA